MSIQDSEIPGLLSEPAWRRNAFLKLHNRSLLRLKIDVKGASDVPERKAGDYVLASWNPGDKSSVQGWLIHGVSFYQILKNSEVVVIK